MSNIVTLSKVDRFDIATYIMVYTCVPIGRASYRVFIFNVDQKLKTTKIPCTRKYTDTIIYVGVFVRLRNNEKKHL